jgi:hypothetical protein
VQPLIPSGERRVAQSDHFRRSLAKRGAALPHIHESWRTFEIVPFRGDFPVAERCDRNSLLTVKTTGGGRKSV